EEQQRRGLGGDAVPLEGPCQLRLALPLTEQSSVHTHILHTHTHTLARSLSHSHKHSHTSTQTYTHTHTHTHHFTNPHLPAPAHTHTHSSHSRTSTLISAQTHTILHLFSDMFVILSLHSKNMFHSLCYMLVGDLPQRPNVSLSHARTRIQQPNLSIKTQQG